jgi:hypothetical protein
MPERPDLSYYGKTKFVFRDKNGDISDNLTAASSTPFPDDTLNIKGEENDLSPESVDSSDLFKPFGWLTTLEECNRDYHLLDLSALTFADADEFQKYLQERLSKLYTSKFITAKEASYLYEMLKGVDYNVIKKFPLKKILEDMAASVVAPTDPKLVGAGAKQ